MSSVPACFAIKSATIDPAAGQWRFLAEKTMYGGRRIAPGDRLFLFDSETQGGRGLVARGSVAGSKAVPPSGAARETPRVTIWGWTIDRATHPLGRTTLRPFRDRTDGSPEAELDFKLYRQATNKIVGLTATAGSFLDGFFDAPA